MPAEQRLLVGDQWAAMRVHARRVQRASSEVFALRASSVGTLNSAMSDGIFHVAMTRAEERLILAGAVTEKADSGLPAGRIVPELVPEGITARRAS